MGKTRNLVDRVLNTFILSFVTKDEWHTLVIGFFDGLSLQMQGKWCRKAFGSPKTDIEGIITEKLWYYKAAYVTGEASKILLILALVKIYGKGVLSILVI